MLPTAQSMSKPLWKWPSSTSSYFPYGAPNSSSSADYNAKSGCSGGGDNNIGWSCPHLMMLSPDMQYAAQADNLSDWAVYAVAGIGAPNDCGSCYQLKVDRSESKEYIVQAANTGSDVSSGQFDILLGAGGFGIYDACSSDCQNGQVCSGGHCNAPMFGGNFKAWTPDGNCYGGCVHDATACNNLVTSSSFADNTLKYGCAEAINQGYHANFKAQWARVQCPESLVKVTGLRRKDNSQYPKPDPTMNLPNMGYTTTTMDCCKPTCAWRQNIEGIADSTFPQIYTCNKVGLPN